MLKTITCYFANFMNKDQASGNLLVLKYEGEIIIDFEVV